MIIEEPSVILSSDKDLHEVTSTGEDVESLFWCFCNRDFHNFLLS